MAKVPTEYFTEFVDHGLECPLCRKPLTVEASVMITKGEMHRNGTHDMVPLVRVSFETKPGKLRISHSCPIPEPPTGARR